jgi:nicotinamidase-related amidase/type 1 glutamine amidotransferase
MFSRHPQWGYVLLSLVCGFCNLAKPSNAQWSVSTTRQLPVAATHAAATHGPYYRFQTEETWNDSETALIICDVWDSHHCVNAVRRVHEIAPRINAMAKSLRERGATIIHSPSDCMKFYEGATARERAKGTQRAANVPKDLDRWCDRIPSEELASYPVDQSDGGEDDDPVEHSQWAKTLASLGRNPKLPWKQQIATIQIDQEQDYVTDVGSEVWNILEDRGIKQVLICGVHTNMCVLGRPFGLRQLTQNGKRAFLVKDLTDTMYNPAQWPFVNHFSGTDLVIDHIERHVCPTVTSDTFLRAQATTAGGDPNFLKPAKFSQDRRPHLAILIADDEYQTEKTLPLLVARHLQNQLKISYLFQGKQSEPQIQGINVLEQADALLLSVRRNPLEADDLQQVRMFLKSGKPLIGIRTASHAFSLRDGKEISGREQWHDFDQVAFGGSYRNHHANELATSVRTAGSNVPLLQSKGSLYRFVELQPGTEISLFGKVAGEPEEPVAWTFVRADGGKSFYTSLGHPADFEESEFVGLLANACLQACGAAPVSNEEITMQRQRYDSGSGKQR